MFATAEAGEEGGARFGPLNHSIPARARRARLVEWHAHNLRDFTHDKHQKTDDRPFGGGPGMVMTCQPLFDAVLAVEALDPRPTRRVLLTIEAPAGLDLSAVFLSVRTPGGQPLFEGDAGWAMAHPVALRPAATVHRLDVVVRDHGVTRSIPVAIDPDGVAVVPLGG